MAIRMRRGLESELNISKAVPGEWLVSTDTKKIRICVQPGIVKEIASVEEVADVIKNGIESIQEAEKQALSNISDGVDETLSVEGKAAEAKVTGEKISQLSSEIGELEEVKSEIFTDYFISTRAKKLLSIDGFTSNDTYGVLFANSYNLLHVSNGVGAFTTSEGAVITIDDDYTYNYDGANATGIGEFDIWKNNELLAKYPFDVTFSCNFDVIKGGFDIFLYYDYNGQAKIQSFVNNTFNLPAGAIVLRIYATTSVADSVFSFKVKANKSDNIQEYDKPTLVYIPVQQIPSITFSKGINVIIPNFIADSQTAKIVYSVLATSIYPSVYDTSIPMIRRVGIEYDTIKNALNSARPKDTVLLYPNTYREKIVGRSTPKRIVGYDKDISILYDDNGNYDNPPVEMSHGLLKNLTIYELSETEANKNHKAYCLHIDDDASINQTLVVENCYMKNLLGTCVGIGMRYGATFIFKNCVIDADTSTALYLHNTAPSNDITSKIIFDNCVFISPNTCLKLQDWSGCCKVEFTFINNTVVSNSEESVIIEYRNYGGVSSEKSTEFKNLFTLNHCSHGNNVEFLNA